MVPVLIPKLETFGLATLVPSDAGCVVGVPSKAGLGFWAPAEGAFVEVPKVTGADVAANPLTVVVADYVVAIVGSLEVFVENVNGF